MRIIIYILLLYVISLTAITTISIVQAGDSPTQPCVNFGTPTDGVYTDPGTSQPVCSDCFIKEHGQPVWDGGLGK